MNNSDEENNNDIKNELNPKEDEEVTDKNISSIEPTYNHLENEEFSSKRSNSQNEEHNKRKENMNL